MSVLQKSEISNSPLNNKKPQANIPPAICADCNQETQPSTFFSLKKQNYCKYCSFSICADCIIKVNTRNNKVICSKCYKKFKSCEMQMEFKSKFEKLELEIKEASQLSESTSLKYSLSTNDIENIKQELNEIRSDYNYEISKIEKELASMMKQKENCDSDCLEINSDINLLIEKYKAIDKEFNETELQKKKLHEERESLYKEFITKQDKLNKLNKENQELNNDLENYACQINKRIVIDLNKEMKVVFVEPVNCKKNNTTANLSKTTTSSLMNNKKKGFMTKLYDL